MAASMLANRSSSRQAADNTAICRPADIRVDCSTLLSTAARNAAVLVAPLPPLSTGVLAMAVVAGMRWGKVSRRYE